MFTKCITYVHATVHEKAALMQRPRAQPYTWMFLESSLGGQGGSAVGPSS